MDLGAEGEGVEPSRLIARPISSRVPSPIGLPFHSSSMYQARIFQSTGGRTRTSNRRLNRAMPYHLATPVSRSFQPDPVGMAGFEPAISCSRSRRINQAFPHPGSSAQRESNPHIRLGKAVGCHYIMGTHQPRPNCQRDGGHRVGLEPTSPHYGCGVFAARRPVQAERTSRPMGPEGLEPSPTRLRAGRSATRALVPRSLRLESARKESNLRLPVISRMLCTIELRAESVIRLDPRRRGSRTPRRSLIRGALCR